MVVIGLAVVLFVFLSREPADKKIKKPEDEEGEPTERLFTEEELQQYDGSEGSKGLYLVILGHVYDVESGRKHYGPGESYSMFVGRDASKSFVTGDFEEYNPEMSDVSPLQNTEIKTIVNWKSFYDERYPYKGKLIGRYFDENGTLTEYHKLILQRAAKAEVEERKPAQEFPTCNVEWKEETGTRVWCTSRSGTGQDRGWIGKPRKYLEQHGDTPFCVCVPDDIKYASLVPFDGCDELSVSCIVNNVIENKEL